jgi:hypothetical protein
MTATNSFDMEAVVSRLLDDRVRQGFPRQCNDPAILAEVARMLREAGAAHATLPKKPPARRRVDA